MDAQRVPPSAWMTSQSTHTLRSPRAPRSTTERSERPMRRWISVLRPSTLPRLASRCLRVSVLPGSIPYSAVTHPLPEPRRQPGTCSSTMAVQMTRVLPAAMSTEPVALVMKPVSMMIGRSSAGCLPSARIG